MHPAFSVIFLTTLIGVGQGLFLALYSAEIGARFFAWVPAQPASFYAHGSAVALLFLAAGLIASFFHLGRPERAWRAAAMWRTSWLSREVIVLPAFMALVLGYGLMHYLSYGHTVVLGAVALVACAALFVCTGMIYACIRFLQEWATPLTIVNFVLLGCASGYTLATAYALWWAPALVPAYAEWALIFTALALLTRAASLVRNARLRPKSSLQTAIGVKHPRIVQKSEGFMGGSFNTREFTHGKAAHFVRSIKWIFLIAVFPIPASLIVAALAWDFPVLVLVAFVVQYGGLIAERWFFFAQARHPQNLYYQTIS